MYPSPALEDIPMKETKRRRRVIASEFLTSQNHFSYSSIINSLNFRTSFILYYEVFKKEKTSTEMNHPLSIHRKLSTFSVAKHTSLRYEWHNMKRKILLSLRKNIFIIWDFERPFRVSCVLECLLSFHT